MRKALEMFGDEEMAVFGSGSSYHNLDAVIESIMNPGCGENGSG